LHSSCASLSHPFRAGYVKDAEVILNEIGGVTKAEKESAQSKVKEAFRKIMGSDRDPDLALTNHYAASLLGGVKPHLRHPCVRSLRLVLWRH
jgi:hypothetical protein